MTLRRICNHFSYFGHCDSSTPQQVHLRSQDKANRCLLYQTLIIYRQRMASLTAVQRSIVNDLPRGCHLSYVSLNSSHIRPRRRRSEHSRSREVVARVPCQSVTRSTGYCRSIKYVLLGSAIALFILCPILKYTSEPAFEQARGGPDIAWSIGTYYHS